MTPATCAVCGKSLSRNAKGALCQRHQLGPSPPQRPYRAPETPDVSRDPEARRYDPEGERALKDQQETAQRDPRTPEERRDDDTKAQNERRRRHQNRGKS